MLNPLFVGDIPEFARDRVAKIVMANGIDTGVAHRRKLHWPCLVEHLRKLCGGGIGRQRRGRRASPFSRLRPRRSLSREGNRRLARSPLACAPRGLRRAPPADRPAAARLEATPALRSHRDGETRH